MNAKTWMRSLMPLAACVGVLLVTRLALAGNFEAESEALITRGARWFQRIVVTLAVFAIAEGGTRFFSESRSPGAREHMKNVLIGCAFAFGSVGLAELIKSSFSGKI